MTAPFKIICYLVAGGVVGHTVPPLVKKKVSPRQEVAKAKGERAVASPSRPRVGRVENRNPPAPRILDCPIGSPFALEPVPGFTLPAPSLPLGAVALGQPGAGGVWPAPNRHTPPTFPPAVPDAPTWAQLVAGFGLIGLSLRTRKAAA